MAGSGAISGSLAIVCRYLSLSEARAVAGLFYHNNTHTRLLSCACSGDNAFVVLSISRTLKWLSAKIILFQIPKRAENKTIHHK